MNSPGSTRWRGASLLTALTMAALQSGLVHAQSPTPSRSPSPVPTPTNPATVEFLKRVDAYVTIHVAAEKALPSLSKESTPQQIDSRQRSMAAKIQAARTGAKRGDIFTPEMTAFIATILNKVFTGKEGVQLRSSIMDENVKYLALRANQRYPDEYPRTTMPSDVLKALPELPEEMEYRFVGPHLILLDQHAHIIPDFIPDALPPAK